MDGPGGCSKFDFGEDIESLSRDGTGASFGDEFEDVLRIWSSDGSEAFVARSDVVSPERDLILAPILLPNDLIGDVVLGRRSACEDLFLVVLLLFITASANCLAFDLGLGMTANGPVTSCGDDCSEDSTGACSCDELGFF